MFNGDFEFDADRALEEALAKGVPLYFLVEFECYRPRWYWLDERIGTAAPTHPLSFHALTRTYRLSTATLHRSHIRRWTKRSTRSRGSASWPAARAARSSSDTTYNAYVRMRLDTAQLPKPFQVNALANREWTLASRLAAVGGERLEPRRAARRMR